MHLRRSGLSTLSDGTKQMSDPWILGSPPNPLNNILINEVGPAFYNQIIASGYTRVLSKVSQNGSIKYFRLNSLGNIIGEWMP